MRLFKICFLAVTTLIVSVGSAHADYILEIRKTAETLTSGAFDILAKHDSGTADTSFSTARFNMEFDITTGGGLFLGDFVFAKLPPAAGNPTPPAPNGGLLGSPGDFSIIGATAPKLVDYDRLGTETLTGGSEFIFAQYTFTLNAAGEDFSTAGLRITPTLNGVVGGGLISPTLGVQPTTKFESAAWGTAVPEPGSIGLVSLFGLAAMGYRRRKA